MPPVWEQIAPVTPSVQKDWDHLPFYPIGIPVYPHSIPENVRTIAESQKLDPFGWKPLKSAAEDWHSIEPLNVIVIRYPADNLCYKDVILTEFYRATSTIRMKNHPEGAFSSFQMSGAGYFPHIYVQQANTIPQKPVPKPPTSPRLIKVNKASDIQGLCVATAAHVHKDIWADIKKRPNYKRFCKKFFMAPLTWGTELHGNFIVMVFKRKGSVGNWLNTQNYCVGALQQNNDWGWQSAEDCFNLPDHSIENTQILIAWLDPALQTDVEPEPAVTEVPPPLDVEVTYAHANLHLCPVGIMSPEIRYWLTDNGEGFEPAVYTIPPNLRYRLRGAFTLIRFDLEDNHWRFVSQQQLTSFLPGDYSPSPTTKMYIRFRKSFQTPPEKFTMVGSDGRRLIATVNNYVPKFHDLDPKLQASFEDSVQKIQALMSAMKETQIMITAPYKYIVWDGTKGKVFAEGTIMAPSEENARLLVAATELSDGAIKSLKAAQLQIKVTPAP